MTLDDLRNSDFAKAIRKQCEEAEDAPADRSGEGWAGIIGGFCPVQGHGHVDGRFWYFRARYDEWRFEVYSEPCDADLPGDDKLVWSREDEYLGPTSAGWMRFSEAWRFIEQSIDAFRHASRLDGTKEGS